MCKSGKIKKPVYQPDNRGSSLLMVILAVAFISVLGTIIISASVINTEMKTADRNSKYNFYLTQAALDEIKTGLEEEAAESLSLAYQSILINYSDNNPAMREELFYKRFVEGMKASLGVGASDNTIPLAVLNNYLKETKKDITSGNGAEITGTPLFEESGSKTSVIIRGLEVLYRSNDYTTSISADVRITLPDRGSSNRLQPPFMEYALIADKELKINFTDSDINGNVYAGSDGINTGYGKQVTITGARVISKGDITVKDTGSLNISGTECEVWADNLITTQTNQGETLAADTGISILGTCYIKDDLILSAYRSKVAITGQYYGYSTGTDSGDNSSVIINAPYAGLDLLGLSKLYLAGRAFLSLEDGSGVVNYHQDEAYGAGSNVNCNILTGESLAVKGSQNAYLLPPQYIQTGHNPVSWSEYISYFDTATGTDHMVAIPSNAEAFQSSSLSVEEKKLSYYLNELCPVKKAFYKFGSNDNVVYYYLNFKTRELATKYFINYMKCYPDKIYNGFPLDYIKLNTSPGALITAGNLMSYTPSLSLISGTNGTFINHYDKYFKNLTSSLHKNIDEASNPAENIVFENIIDVAKLRTAAASHADGKLIEREINLEGEDYYTCVLDNESTGSFSFDLSGKKGIIVATGDVSVNRSFTGLILANGTIRLNAPLITGDSVAVKKLLSADEELAGYFKAFAGSDTGAEDASDLIEFENWRKE